MKPFASRTLSLALMAAGCGAVAFAQAGNATEPLALLFKMERSMGAIEAGFEADLIAFAENPLEDVRTLQDPLLIVSNGRAVLDRLNFGKK